MFFQARIHEGEALLIVAPCTFGSDPLDRRMVALTDDALYLCAVPPKGAFMSRIPYAEITSVDTSRVTRVDIEREPGSAVTLRSISTQELIRGPSKAICLRPKRRGRAFAGSARNRGGWASP